MGSFYYKKNTIIYNLVVTKLGLVDTNFFKGTDQIKSNLMSQV